MKNTRSRWSRLAMIVLSLAVVAVFSMPTVFADGNGSMLLNFTCEGEQINGAEFDLYKVADLKQDESVDEVVESFAPYADLIKGLKTPTTEDTSSTDDWRKASVRLADFVTLQNIKADDTATTGKTGSGSGKAAFGHLDNARYLVVGKPLEKDGKVYTGAPFLADIQGEPRTANIKPDVKDKTDESLKVKKIWEKDNPNQRPETIQVRLLMDGKPLNPDQIKVLDASMGWESTPWMNLETGHKWSVEEISVPGYNSVVGDPKDGVTTITNTYNPPPPGGRTKTYTVQKVWVDNGNEDIQHPDSIRVQLYVGNERYDEPKTLSESNSWKARWTGISSNVDDNDITVVEVDGLVGYSAVVTKEGTQLTLTNTYNPPDNPDIPDDPTPLGPPGVDYTVKKVWEDKGYETKRPTSVDVILTKDGKEYDTQTLNEANGWKYTWTDLDGEATWSVKEKSIPAGYEVKTSLENYTVTMTNTYNPENKTTPPSGTTKKTGKLPQTGMLWWPVPVLGCAGLLLILLGLVRKNKRRRTDGE